MSTDTDANRDPNGKLAPKCQDKRIITTQRNEITEYHIYSSLAKLIKSKENSAILQRIADDEKRHYDYWKSISGVAVKPNMFQARFYTFISYVFGLSFGLRLMERGEELAQVAYEKLGDEYPGSKEIMLDEHEHEQKLLGMLKEEKIDYASSIVLGLNDALVELTGALAGFTFALQKGRLIGIIGLITGLAASMSMAASGYLASKEEDSEDKAPIKSAIYTGGAYVITVFLLVLPFFFITNVFVALGVTLLLALLIIFSYTFYIAVAKGYNFWHRFLEMAAISLSVALISFIIGWLIKVYFNVDV
ncbi:MAG: rubrerythrin family protein [Lentisphaerae bacterium]|nr:rubrerythrin family protein [Lentisphaerota bacterium]